MAKKMATKSQDGLLLDKIKCPQCGELIPISETLQHQLTEKMRLEFEEKMKGEKLKIKVETEEIRKDFEQKNREQEEAFSLKERELKEKEKEVLIAKKKVDVLVEEKLKNEKSKIEQDAKKKAEAVVSLELKDLLEQVKEKDKKLEEAQKAELELRKRERELEEGRKKFELEMAQKHEEFEDEFAKKEKEIKEKFEKEIKQKAEEAIALKLEDLRSQISEKDEKLQKARNDELDLLKQKRELEESKRTFELEMTRKLDEEREKIRNTTLEEAMNGHRIKDLEKDKQISEMIKQIDDLKRKAEQGSQQTQGEVLELELEEILKSKFPHDDIEPVPVGMKGSDILQNVCSPSGQLCGIIAWEAKNTKTWSEGWISKLKEDQRETNADISILVTMALPKDISTFGLKNGIWVTNYDSLLGLATAIRMNLIQVAVTKQSAVGKNEKMEILYNYLTSPAFKHKVEAIVEAFKEMQEDVSEEKRIFAKRWAKREKQIERVILSTSGMYGDMQGLIGKQMQSIPALELKEDKKGRNE